MLVAPLSNTPPWSWKRGRASNLPKELRFAFPSTAAGLSPETAPKVEPEWIERDITGAQSRLLLFPFTGRVHHHHDPQNGVHWIWGRAADLTLFPTLRVALPHGNPLIALRFPSALIAAPDSFPPGGDTKGTSVSLQGSAQLSVDHLAIIAAYPRRPGLDTLAVLRDLRSILGGAGADPLGNWSAFVTEMDVIDAPLRLLEPSGRPITDRAITLERPNLAPIPANLAKADGGDVLSATNLSRADLVAGTRLIIAGQGEDITAVVPGLAAQSLGVDINEAVTPVAHVDVAPLEDWFGAQSSAALTRFTRGNRVKPFINGPDFFDDFFGEMNAAAANPLLYLTGYGIDESTEFASVASGLQHRSLAAAAVALAAAGGEVRFLALQRVQPVPGFQDDAKTGALVAALVLAIAGGVATFFQDSKGWDQLSFFAHIQALAVSLMVGATSLQSILDILESNKDPIDALDVAHAAIKAFLDPYPADCDDNPRCVKSNELVGLALNAQRKFNAFHQKIAVVRNDAGFHSYCGGIDLSANRLDDRDHGVRAPFHDVHAKVNGPAAGELARTFAERWTRTGSPQLTLDFTTLPATLPTDGPDIVQTGRTYYGPKVSGQSGLAFAPDGERTILNTLLKAIGQARRYIYIEDQYLTPPEEYSDALVAASRQVSGPLIIVIPETPDQPFGLGPRIAFVDRLRLAWGDRLKVGTMRHRFYRTQTTRKSAQGRLWLAQDVTETDQRVFLDKASRVPDTPFWFIVGKEAMYAVSKTEGSQTATQIEVKVLRGDDTRLFKGPLGNSSGTGTKKTKHPAGAAVTAGNFAGIYVHAKIMLVDDVFASIGSANCNRRGYYSDGECNLFTLRSELSHGDNWIRDLRTRLWSELAGVSEAFGAVAFADPGQNRHLFDRKFVTGNRFSDFEARVYKTDLEVQAAFNNTTSTLGGLGFIAKTAAFIPQIVVGSSAVELFDSFIDPSSGVQA